MWLTPSGNADRVVIAERRWRARVVRAALHRRWRETADDLERELCQHICAQPRERLAAGPELTRWSMLYLNAAARRLRDERPADGCTRLILMPALEMGWHPASARLVVPVGDVLNLPMATRAVIIRGGRYGLAEVSLETLAKALDGAVESPAVELSPTVHGVVTDGGDPLLTELLDDCDDVAVAPPNDYVAALDRVLTLVGEHWPALLTEIKLTVQRIVPFESRARSSFTNMAVRGTIYLSTSLEDPVANVDRVVHEAAHLRLASIEREYRLHTEEPTKLVFSPFRNERRPVDGLLHGIFVFARSILALERMASALDTKRCNEVVESHRERLMQGLAIAKSHLRLTDAGELLLEEISNAAARTSGTFSRLLEPVSAERDALLGASRRTLYNAVPLVLERLPPDHPGANVTLQWAAATQSRQRRATEDPRFIFSWYTLFRSVCGHDPNRSSAVAQALRLIRSALDPDRPTGVTVSDIEIAARDEFTSNFMLRLKAAPAPEGYPPRDLRPLSSVNEAHKAALGKALDLIFTVWPAIELEFRSYVRLLVLFQSEWQSTFTDGAFFGAVFLSEALRPFSSRNDLAEHLVHEEAHLRMCVLSELVPLTVSRPNELYPSPWRSDPRPFWALLQSAYAFARISMFLRLAETATADPWFTARTAEVTRSLAEATATLAAADVRWAPLGARLLEDIEAECLRN